MALKTNSKRVLDIIASQKKQNATAAYKQVHPNASQITAGVNSYKLLKKPEAQIYLKKHIENAKKTIVELSQSANKEEVRLKASQDIVDRTHGKATQLNQNTNININIDTAIAELI